MRGMGIRTALVRKNGELQTQRRSGYSSNKELEYNLRLGGYKIVKIWNWDVPQEIVDAWYANTHKRR